MIIYFSKLRGKPISDSEGNRIGALDDLIVQDGEKFAEVSFLVVRINGKPEKIPASSVASYNGVVMLSKPRKEIEFSDLAEKEILLREMILDRQLIDINGLKVVRVKDILLADVSGKLGVVSVDAGIHGFMRRLGITIPIGKEANLIPWEYVEPVSIDKELRLKVPRQKIASLHPADIADLLEELSPKQRANVFGTLDVETAADTLAESEPEVTKSVLAEIKEKKIASVLERMAPDEAADVLSMLQSTKANEIIKLLNPEFTHKVQDLLHYGEQTAGRMMNPDIIAVHVDNTAQEAIEYLRKRSPVADRSYYVYVMDRESKIVGVLSLRELIISPPEKKVADFMKTNVIKVLYSAPREEAAKLIVKYNLSVLPVVDEKDKLLGIIAADDVMSGVMPESFRRMKPKRKYYLRKRKNKNGKNNKNSA
ncbi:MAG TPA: CBS domain-containing protein [Candidatus Nanoarchaeia archaeon]|nr:CBS domain-containing protein [Candidatus Nanoarchaeia archaeon]